MTQRHSIDEYLETIYFLAFPIGEYHPQTSGSPTLAARVAEMLGVSRPSAGEMLKRLEAEGLIERGEHKEAILTVAGRERAERVVRRHRLIERLLTDFMGYSPAESHELDVNNLARWFTGAIGASGPLTRDGQVAPYNFVVYFSDRRSNYVAAPIAGGWPPPSPSGNETGEYGFQDFVNPANQFACPNGNLDQGEDLDGLGPAPFFTYGQASPPVFTNALLTNSQAATAADPNCAMGGAIWPGTFLVNSNEARQNPPAFFRRALKVVNGSQINLGGCPGGEPCGLTIATENAAYVQGDYNCGSAPGTPCTGFNNPHVASAILSDSFTFLSRNWNDVNSFLYPYDNSPTGSGTPQRNALTTYYRVGIVAGKGVSFQQPVGYATPQDFGTDGGTHNFLRYVEDWGGQTLNYRGSILSLYYNRQASGVYKCCATVYSPPTRAYNFDVEFLEPSKLPPRTPMFRDVNTTGFSQLILPKQ